MTQRLIRRAYAKINLTLDIRARRPDGYHDLRSVMQAIALHDTLAVSLTPDMPGVILTVNGDEAEGVPVGPDNIVHQAAVRLQKIAAARGTHPGHRSGLQIHLTKRIPSQAGLGGGSSDAAAALRLCDKIFDLRLSPKRLGEIAAGLGADVSFFLVGGSALVEGLGERVTPMPPPKPGWPLVVIKPPVGVSTPSAYAALDAIPNRLPGHATDDWLRKGSVFPIGNDFESVVLPMYPAVRAAYLLLSQTTIEGDSFKPLLCGSGAAVFCRARDEAHAAQIVAAARAADIGKVWMTQTQENIDDD